MPMLNDPSLNIDTSRPVLVTGATGYVAGHLVRQLLAAGVTVHAAVRDTQRESKIRHLNEMAGRLPGDIRYFEADLLDDGSYAKAMQGCAIVFHTASPFVMHANNPQREIVDPARLGTRNVLLEANRSSDVRRVVLTSSCAAIYGDNADVYEAPGQVLTEAVWNTSSSLDHQPYSYSKTVAEQEAWEIAGKQSTWDLVTINPSLVLGPGLSAQGTSGSFSIIKKLGDGTLRFGAPRFGFGCVDVRDVADAHLAAAFLPAAHGRYIISGHDSDLYELAQILRKQFGKQYPVPSSRLPKWLAWLFAPFLDPSMTRKIISRNVEVAFRADNTKSQQELGLEYRSLEESVIEMFQQMIDDGYFK